MINKSLAWQWRRGTKKLKFETKSSDGHVVSVSYNVAIGSSEVTIRYGDMLQRMLHHGVRELMSLYDTAKLP